MTRASTADQIRLLALQDLDSALALLDSRRRSLPEAAEVASLEQRAATLDQDAVILRTRVADLDREVAKAEREVEQVRSRAAKDQARLDAGTGNAKDLVGLQHELQSLAARQNDLEEVELEVMERRETEAARLAAVESELASVRERLVDATARRDVAAAEIMTNGRRVYAERTEAVAGIDAGLVALYEKIRAGRGGVGAARLDGARCEGCHLDLPPSDLSRIRAMAPDEIALCEECGRILVRSAPVAAS